MIRQLITSMTLSVGLIATKVPAPEIEIVLFGSSVSITRADDQERLVIDGREILKNHYVSIEKILIVGGTPVAVGTSSMGGKACDGSPFLISFPPAGNPRIDGPLDTCSGVGIAGQENSLVLSTSATPDSPGHKWVWTPSDGVKSIAGEKFVANTAKGWPQLRERVPFHPSELLDYAEIANQINLMAGTDRALVNDILMGSAPGVSKVISSSARPARGTCVETKRV